MPIRAPEGYLDITNATLRASEITTTSKVGIANANPTNTLSVGSNLHVSATSSNVLTIRGNVVTEGIKMGFLEIVPSYNLEQTANVGNSMSNTIQFTNSTTSFVTSSNVGIGTVSPSGLLDVVDAFTVAYTDRGHTAATIAAGYNTLSITNAGGTYTYTRDIAGLYGNFLIDTTAFPPAIGTRYRVRLTARSDNPATIRLENPANTGVIATYNLTSTFATYTWEFTAVATTVYFRVTFTSGSTMQFNALKVEEVLVNVGSRLGVGTTSPAYTLDVSGTARTGALTATSGTFSGALTASQRYLSDIPRPYQETITNSTSLAVGWYRIAENGDAVNGAGNGSRCSARFTIMDTKTGYHSSRTLYAGATYGDTPFIHLLTNSSLGGVGGVVSKVRIVEDALYEGHAVEIYLDTAVNANEVRIVIDDNYQRFGFVLIDFESVPADHSGMNEHEVDLDTKVWGVFYNGTSKTINMDTSGNVGIGTTNPAYKLQISGDALVNTGEASWNTGMKSILSTQDLINKGVFLGRGTVTASTDVDLPPDVVNDVIAKFTNNYTGEAVIDGASTNVLGNNGDVIVIDMWLYNNSGSTISVQYYVYAGGAQDAAFDLPSTSSWIRYTRSITLDGGNSGNNMAIRLDNNTPGTTFYFTGLSVRVNPSNTTNAPFTPKGFPLSGTGTVLSVPNIVAKEASIPTLLGNVGIGTTNPFSHGLLVAKDVTHGTSTTQQLRTQATVSNATYVEGTATLGFSGRGGSDIVNAATFWKSLGGYYGTQGYFGIAVNNPSTGVPDPYGITEGELDAQTRLVISHSGNVGIGTTNPLSTLTAHVDYGAGQTSGLCLDATNGVEVYNLRLFSYVEASSKVAYRFRVNNLTTSSEAMSLLSDGRVVTHQDLVPVTNIHYYWDGDKRLIYNYDNNFRQGIKFSDSGRTMTIFSTSNDSDGSIAFSTRLGVGSSDTDYGTERMRITGTGNVGIGTTSPGVKLHVYDSNSAGTMLVEKTGGAGGGIYMGNGSHGVGRGMNITNFTDSNDVVLYTAGTGSSGLSTSSGAYYLKLSSQGDALSSDGTPFGLSDERIKKDIIDIDDTYALQKIREIKPRMYRYKSHQKHNQTVFGFIAQEIRETLPYSTLIGTETIPNIQDYATFSNLNSNVITFTNFNTSDLDSNSNTIRIFHDDLEGREEYSNTISTVNLIRVIDDHAIEIDTDLLINEIFVYGQQVEDFHFLKKEHIFTVATAALQEVDRQQQADKLRITELETQLASVLARLDALESA
ncbi:hypothetical protein [Dishui Lake phycodnavirus 3]|nr:hypothetical protein [Dishui Lake phycodnavirus 3]